MVVGRKYANQVGCGAHISNRILKLNGPLHGPFCSGSRRIAQTGAFNLQARPGPVAYASGMSSAEQAIALFADREAGPATGYGATPSSEDTWDVRRAIVRARSALISMRLDDAWRATTQLRRLLGNRPDWYFAGYGRATRILEASILAAEDDFTAARTALMGVASNSTDSLAATILRYVSWKIGERAEVSPVDTVDYLAPPVGGKTVDRILSLCVSAALTFDRLQLAVSANLATEALQLARLRYGCVSAMTTFPAALLAQVAYEQGRFEEAEALLRPRLSVFRSSGMRECLGRATVLLARLSLHRGRHREALALLRETEALGRGRRWPGLVSIVSSEHARAVDTLRPDEGGEDRYSRDQAPIVLSDRGQRASVPPDEGLSFSALESALRRVCAAASDRSHDSAHELLIPWLRIGAARGLRMAFLDAGRPLVALLGRLYHALPTNDPRLSDLRPYIATLLRSTIQPNTEESPSKPYPLLSRRETGILQMIARGMSNKRIAQSLGITPETVKSHAKSIFIKLATRTRAQAVARAEAIGFL
jgi:LuxR family transcriptional regulator, maltose regulon positive regulatory protein